VPSLVRSTCNSLGLSVEPHDAAIEVMIERLVRTEASVHLRLLSETGERHDAELSADEADELELVEGQILFRA
jgi:hypothetical protein